jgi:hypothetical protein
MQCILYKIYFWKGFSYVLQIDMHLICTPMLAKFYSCKKWLLHVIFGEGMFLDSSKIRDMFGWSAPSRVNGCESSLGIVGYYHKIIEGFSKTT